MHVRVREWGLLVQGLRPQQGPSCRTGLESCLGVWVPSQPWRCLAVHPRAPSQGAHPGKGSTCRGGRHPSLPPHPSFLPMLRVAMRVAKVPSEVRGVSTGKRGRVCLARKWGVSPLFLGSSCLLLGSRVLWSLQNLPSHPTASQVPVP